MQLTYRAANYELNSTVVKVANSDRIGMYRGTKIKFSSPAVTRKSHAHTSSQLKYRGINYTIWH
ncbi:DUF4278 domain-containing protein [Chlorogloeopsis sp. ULAP02]|uniref:DUF4278 domain-containing protein n=1 Tax=Chlorogloeopsis sp. ULAP02 TaxID=3107926 RepID=UPI003136C54B